MHQLLKIALIIAVSLGASNSFAECSIDPNLRLIKFPPTDLAIYLTPESTVEKEEMENYAATYVNRKACSSLEIAYD